MVVRVSNRTGTSIEFALRGRRIVRGTTVSGHSLINTTLASPGYRSMNTKLALSAIVAALMLTACAKQESAGTDQAATPPAPAAPAADSASTPPASGTATPDQAAPASPPADQAAPATPPAD